jgi:hypothetical protein
MRSAHITRRQAEAAFDGLDADVSALQGEVAVSFDRYQIEIDRLIEEVDRELAAEERTATVRLIHSFTDRQRAQRACRRANRVVLGRLSYVEGEAA